MRAFVLAAASLVGTQALAEPQAITTNLAAPVGGIAVSALTGDPTLAATLEYERAFAAHWSGYAGLGGLISQVPDHSVGGFGVSVGARWYWRAPLCGFWAGPDLNATSVLGVGRPVWNGIVSAYAGYDLRAGGFVASLGAGVGWRVGPLGAGVVPGLRLNVGWAF